MNLKSLEAHRALEKNLTAVNTEARALLATGAKVGHVVALTAEAQQLIALRTRDIAATLSVKTPPAKPAKP
jgi:hypothetical protein